MDTLSRAYRNYTKNESVIIGKALQRLVQGTQDTMQCLQELDEFGVRIGEAHSVWPRWILTFMRNGKAAMREN